MKHLYALLLMSRLIHADNLDMFDIADQDDNSSLVTDASNLNMSIQLSHLIQDPLSNETVLYANISNHGDSYGFDLRLEANEDVQSLHIKDLYYRKSFDERYFLELGRMNIKEGIAHGYNPTDYFKGGSSFTLSVDPKDRKENRLGAVLLQTSAILDAYTIKALYSPKISVSDDSIGSNKEYIGLHLDESNNQERASLYIGYTGSDDFSISGILHHNDDGLNAGINLSYISERTIWYAEASVAYKKTNLGALVDDLPLAEIRDAFASEEDYRTELSLGVNYTSDSNIISTFEYIYSDAGMSESDWEDYFALSDSSPHYAGVLGGIRGSVMGDGSKLSKHTLFVMARQNDIIPNLDWRMMAWINPLDKSTMVQLGASYEYKDIVFSADARAYLGDDETEYGSYPNEYESLLSMTYYF